MRLCPDLLLQAEVRGVAALLLAAVLCARVQADVAPGSTSKSSTPRSTRPGGTRQQKSTETAHVYCPAGTTCAPVSRLCFASAATTPGANTHGRDKEGGCARACVGGAASCHGAVYDTNKGLGQGGVVVVVVALPPEPHPASSPHATKPRQANHATMLSHGARRMAWGTERAAANPGHGKKARQRGRRRGREREAWPEGQNLLAADHLVGVVLFGELLHVRLDDAATETEHEVECGFLLDVVV